MTIIVEDKAVVIECDNNPLDPSVTPVGKMHEFDNEKVTGAL